MLPVTCLFIYWVAVVCCVLVFSLNLLFNFSRSTLDNYFFNRKAEMLVAFTVKWSNHLGLDLKLFKCSTKIYRRKKAHTHTILYHLYHHPMFDGTDVPNLSPYALHILSLCHWIVTSVFTVYNDARSLLSDEFEFWINQIWFISNYEFCLSIAHCGFACMIHDINIVGIVCFVFLFALQSSSHLVVNRRQCI